MVCYCVDTLDTKKQKVMQFIQGVIMLALGGPSDTIARWSKIVDKGSESCSLSSNIGNWWTEGRWERKVH
jgi:hypothetical protein